MLYSKIARTAIAVCLTVLLSAATAAFAGLPATVPADLKLLNDLDNDNPKIRDQAQDQLSSMPRLRPWVIYQMNHGGSDELRMRAEQALIKLPWSDPDDPAAVSGILRTYGDADPEVRSQRLDQLLALPPRDCANAALRLMDEEPSIELRWRKLVPFLMDSPAPIQDRLRKLRPEDDIDASAPMLALVAMATLPRDPERAEALYRKALEKELLQPCGDQVLLQGRITYFIHREISTKRYVQAATLLRLASRLSWEPLNGQGAPLARVQEFSTPPQVVQELFALHAKFGPLPGFKEDLATYSQFAGTPEIALELSHIHRQADRFSVAEACETYARSMCSVEPELVVRLADFLMGHDQRPQARRMLNDAIACGSSQPDISQFWAHRLMAVVALEGGDHDRAADEFQASIDLLDSIPNLRADHPDELSQEVVWQRFSGAKARGQTAVCESYIPALVTVVPRSVDIAIDIYQALIELKHPDDAKTFFEAAYKASRQALDENGTVLARNNHIWFCIRCNQHLEELVKMCDILMEDAPNNPAFLDTAASVYFAIGNTARAIELETYALNVVPDNIFMQKQLKLFKGIQAE